MRRRMSKCPFHHASVDSTTTKSTEDTVKQHRVEVANPVAQSAEPQCPYLRKKQESAENQSASAVGEGRDWTKATPAEFKEHFQKAYDDVAVATASQTFRSDIAAKLVSQLGYTPEEIKIVGDDVALMQGTGNPHVLANIQPGETVVDLGSGFGIDAVLAATRVGKAGRVVGIDLSVKEIQSALQRVSGRRLRNVDFRLGDIEDMPIEDEVADCVISNGGFCLVPDKPRAFREVFRVLRRGGRFSISCTVRKQTLDPTKHWPSCMVVFMPLDTVKSMLTEIGFSDIVIDESNSRMDLWDSTDPTGEKTATSTQATESASADATAVKVTIHKGDSQFDFLRQMNMNDWFARVNIFARK